MGVLSISTEDILSRIDFATRASFEEELDLIKEANTAQFKTLFKSIFKGSPIRLPERAKMVGSGTKPYMSTISTRAPVPRRPDTFEPGMVAYERAKTQIIPRTVPEPTASGVDEAARVVAPRPAAARPSQAAPPTPPTVSGIDDAATQALQRPAGRPAVPESPTSVGVGTEAERALRRESQQRILSTTGPGGDTAVRPMAPVVIDDAASAVRPRVTDGSDAATFAGTTAQPTTVAGTTAQPTTAATSRAGRPGDRSLGPRAFNAQQNAPTPAQLEAAQAAGGARPIARRRDTPPKPRAPIVPSENPTLVLPEDLAAASAAIQRPAAAADDAVSRAAQRVQTPTSTAGVSQEQRAVDALKRDMSEDNFQRIYNAQISAGKTQQEAQAVVDTQRSAFQSALTRAEKNLERAKQRRAASPRAEETFAMDTAATGTGARAASTARPQGAPAAAAPTEAAATGAGARVTAPPNITGIPKSVETNTTAWRRGLIEAREAEAARLGRPLNPADEQRVSQAYRQQAGEMPTRSQATQTGTRAAGQQAEEAADTATAAFRKLTSSEERAKAVFGENFYNRASTANQNRMDEFASTFGEQFLRGRTAAGETLDSARKALRSAFETAGAAAGSAGRSAAGAAGSAAQRAQATMDALLATPGKLSTAIKGLPESLPAAGQAVGDAARRAGQGAGSIAGGIADASEALVAGMAGIGTAELRGLASARAAVNELSDLSSQINRLQSQKGRFFAGKSNKILDDQISALQRRQQQISGELNSIAGLPADMKNQINAAIRGNVARPLGEVVDSVQAIPPEMKVQIKEGLRQANRLDDVLDRVEGFTPEMRTQLTSAIQANNAVGSFDDIAARLAGDEGLRAFGGNPMSPETQQMLSGLIGRLIPAGSTTPQAASGLGQALSEIPPAYLAAAAAGTGLVGGLALTSGGGSQQQPYQGY